MSELAAALIEAQKELPTAIGKDADGQIGTRQYRYLTLDKLIEVTRPTLTKHGLTIVQAPTTLTRGEDAAIPVLSTVVMHVSGEMSDAAFTPLYLTDKTMQGLGAADTREVAEAWMRDPTTPASLDESAGWRG